MYARCPIILESMLQVQISLSATESDYITLSKSICNTILAMKFLQEINKEGFSTLSTPIWVFFKSI